MLMAHAGLFHDVGRVGMRTRCFAVPPSARAARLIDETQPKPTRAKRRTYPFVKSMNEKTVSRLRVLIRQFDDVCYCAALSLFAERPVVEYIAIVPFWKERASQKRSSDW